MGLPNSRDLTFIPGTSLVPSATMNNIQDSIVNLRKLSSSPLYGDGSDGAATLDGTAAAPAWATKSGSIYTMTRDCYCTTLLVTGASVVLRTNGYRIYATQSVTTASGGTMNNNGADATSLAIGAAGHDGTFKGGAAGGASGSPNGSAGAGPGGTTCGGGGGAGGNNASGGLGGSGGGNLPQGKVQNLYSAVTFGYSFDVTTGAFTPLAGAGGGGGGSIGGADAGMGGAGGGVITIATRSLVLANATDVMARGGNGGNADAGGAAGGGGGGGGGSIHLACAELTVGVGTLAAATNVPGGSGGTNGGGTGHAGTAGDTGRLFVFQGG